MTSNQLALAQSAKALKGVRNASGRKWTPPMAGATRAVVGNWLIQQTVARHEARWDGVVSAQQ